eukprot:5557217-Pleurochrysis_carterae.AAC.1
MKNMKYDSAYLQHCASFTLSEFRLMTSQCGLSYTKLSVYSCELVMPGGEEAGKEKPNQPVYMICEKLVRRYILFSVSVIPLRMLIFALEISSTRNNVDHRCARNIVGLGTKPSPRSKFQ